MIVRQLGVPVGTLAVLHSHPFVFAQEDLEFLQSVAGLVGRVLELENLKFELQNAQDSLELSAAVVQDSALESRTSGLPNARFLDVWIKGNLHHGRRYKESLSLALWELREDAPRAALRAFSQGLRGNDLLVELAPHRFLLLMPMTLPEGAEVVLARLQADLGHPPMGATLWMPDRDDLMLRGALLRAGQALKEAAREGSGLRWKLPALVTLDRPSGSVPPPIPASPRAFSSASRSWPGGSRARAFRMASRLSGVPRAPSARRAQTRAGSGSRASRKKPFLRASTSARSGMMELEPRWPSTSRAFSRTLSCSERFRPLPGLSSLQEGRDRVPDLELIQEVHHLQLQVGACGCQEAGQGGLRRPAADAAQGAHRGQPDPTVGVVQEGFQLGRPLRTGHLRQHQEGVADHEPFTGLQGLQQGPFRQMAAGAQAFDDPASGGRGHVPGRARSARYAAAGGPSRAKEGWICSAAAARSRRNIRASSWSIRSAVPRRLSRSKVGLCLPIHGAVFLLLQVLQHRELGGRLGRPAGFHEEP